MENELQQKIEELLAQQERHNELLMNHLLHDERAFQRLTDHLIGLQTLLADSIKGYQRNLLYGIGAVGGVVLVVEIIMSYVIRLI